MRMIAFAFRVYVADRPLRYTEYSNIIYGSATAREKHYHNFSIFDTLHHCFFFHSHDACMCMWTNKNLLKINSLVSR